MISSYAWVLGMFVSLEAGAITTNGDSSSGPVREHPFLICRRGDFVELRARAEREPWKTMKAEALRRASEGPPQPVQGDRVQRYAVHLQQYLGALALAYLVDEENPRLQAERIAAAITNGLAAVVFKPSLQHAGTVPPMGAAFVAILALDIAWNDLTREEIRECEKVIERQIRKIAPTGSWLGARLGTHGTWAIYRGERTEPDDAYYQDFIRQMTRDGVSTVSPGYAFARLGAGPDRPQKSGYADVLEFTGVDRRYYNDSRIKAFYRWLFSASITPARQFHPFGDVTPVWNPPNSPLLWRVGRFDRQAAAYAAWFLAGKSPPPHVLSYVLMTEPLPESEVPKSQIFRYGGAFLREPADSPLALGAMLYNIVENDEGHTHEEVNAISLAAYGNRLLVNGGWLGDETRPPWKNNTLAINRKRHMRKVGAGIPEGFTADGFDFARGDSGRALTGGRFDRSLLFIHSRSGTGGYFVTWDDVQAAAGDAVHFFLQTASEEPAEEKENGLYRYRVNHHARKPGVSTLVAFATSPEKVMQEQVESGFLERTPESGYHNRIEAVFRADTKGRCSILTFYVPLDQEMAEPLVQRVEGENYRGFFVQHPSGVRDMILEGGKEAAQYGASEFQGCLALWRDSEMAEDGFYFVRSGQLFRRGAAGFSSSMPVSIFMRPYGGTVLVSSDKTEFTLWIEKDQRVRLNGRDVESASGGEGWIRFPLTVGSHSLSLEVGQVGP